MLNPYYTSVFFTSFKSERKKVRRGTETKDHLLAS